MAAKLASTDAKRYAGQKSAAKLAALVGTSTRKVEKIQTIRKYGGECLIEQIMSGEITINRAYNLVQEKRHYLEEGGS